MPYWPREESIGTVERDVGAKRRTGPSVVAIVYDGLCTFEFGIAVEIFGLSRPEFGGDWYRFGICSAEGSVVRATGGHSLLVEAGLEAVDDADIVIVPGWRGPHERPPEDLLEAIVAAHRRGARVVGICGGVFVLAATGLLSNKCATTHWRFLDDFVEQNPDVRVDRALLYCDEDRILTSAGSAAGIDLCLHIVRSDYGTEIADQVARRLVTAPLRGGSQPQESPTSLVPEGRDQLLADFLVHLRQDVAMKYTSEAAARELGMSQRTFHRRFKSLTGQSYGVWMSLQRIERAKHLLSKTDLTIERITEACGLSSSGSLRRLFGKFVGEGPKDYRKRLRESGE